MFPVRCGPQRTPKPRGDVGGLQAVDMWRGGSIRPRGTRLPACSRRCPAFRLPDLCLDECRVFPRVRGPVDLELARPLLATGAQTATCVAARFPKSVDSRSRNSSQPSGRTSLRGRHWTSEPRSLSPMPSGWIPAATRSSARLLQAYIICVGKRKG